jgi:heptosyltransferase-2
MSPTRPSPDSPILVVTYTWIGDFVRSHSVVTLLRQRWPDRPVDVVTSSLCAPLVDYMPGVRQSIVCDLPRGRLPLGLYTRLAMRLRAERYGTAVVLLRTWKSALAPFLAGIPERVGFFGEVRFGLINDPRRHERRYERMIDCMGVLALPRDAAVPAEWPLPELYVPPSERAAWLARRGLTDESRPLVALAPGAVGPGKRWSSAHFAALARGLAEDGVDVWVLGGPNERAFAQEIVAAGGPRVTDLTGNDLRDAIVALSIADAAVANDSGLMHVAAALGTRTVALFGPTDPHLWAPLNPLAAVIEPPAADHCPQCGRSDCTAFHHRDVDDIAPDRVLATVRAILAVPEPAPPAAQDDLSFDTFL